MADLFEGGERLQMNESIDLTIQSMQAYGADHDHWGIARSGGKDSTATLTLLAHLLDTGRIPRPRTLTVFYADTRQELTPLAIAAARARSPARGCHRDRPCARAVTPLYAKSERKAS